eukprot:Skav232966  [mRNA]  locus=scaffold1735:124190:143444:- [translate_table: standard]
MEHPDPCRYQLRHAVNRLSMWKAARDCEFWVFYDYMSLYQFERFSEAECRSFGAAMDNMHVLYAHECTVTLRIQSLTPDFLWQAVKDQAELIPVYDAGTKSVVRKTLSDLKPNPTLYTERGWCKAEVEWSSLRTVNRQHQRICPSDGEEVSGESTSCRVPMTPQKFESTMKHSKFTHKSDSTTVISLQAKVFKEKVSACESLVLEGIPPAQMVALADVLPFYKCLKRLKLSNFECSEEEAMAFGKALATSKVESLELQQPRQPSGSYMGKAIVKALERSSLSFINPEYQNFFEKEDAKVVMQVLRSKTYSRARLPFDAPVRLQALSTALEMNNISSMTDINLEGEQIGDPGAEALAEMLQVNASVKSLNLALTGISEGGAQAWSVSGVLWSPGSGAAARSSESSTRCQGLRRQNSTAVRSKKAPSKNRRISQILGLLRDTARLKLQIRQKPICVEMASALSRWNGTNCVGEAAVCGEENRVTKGRSGWPSKQEYGAQTSRRRKARTAAEESDMTQHQEPVVTLSQLLFGKIGHFSL